MTHKTTEKDLARRLQREEGISYSEALRRVRATAGDAICKVCSSQLQKHAGKDHDFVWSGRNTAPPAARHRTTRGLQPTTSGRCEAFGGDIRRFDGKLCREVAPALRAGFNDMKARPEHYRQFDSPNGWGTYDSLLLSVVDDMASACEANPDGVFHVH